jgi:hypothetical protein
MEWAMCEFCVSHGEGKIWYENMPNYSRKLFLKVNSDGGLKKLLCRFGQSMRDNIPKAEKWQNRLPGICRKIATGAVAKTEISDLDKEGMTHSVWTFNTPYIGAICNCDQDCMAYRIQYRSKLAKVMWKGEYVANIAADRCRVANSAESNVSLTR